MATQIVIANESSIKIDDSFHIDWTDKGNAMPAIPNTVHFVIWNTLPGQNEIQNKDASTGLMVSNVDLSSTGDAVGSTTLSALLTWSETRKDQIIQAQTDYSSAVADDEENSTTNAEGKTWIDYDPNYS